MQDFSRRYRLVGRLGSGAFGIVDLAYDEQRQEYVALKRLRSESPLRELRLKREFRLLASVRHPSVVRLYDLGLDDQGWPFFTMEYVRGLDLYTRYRSTSQRMVEGPHLDLVRLRSYFSQLVEAVSALHAAGIVHRDLTPRNVLITDGGLLKVVDFGVSYGLQSGSRLTNTTPIGTPTYMAPEQVRGAAPTFATDRYALGTALFELITGSPPFRGKRDAVLLQQLTVPAPRLASVIADVPPALDEVCAALLAKLPEERPSLWSVAAALGVRAAPELRERRPELLERQSTITELAAFLQGGNAGFPIARLTGSSGSGRSALLRSARTLAVAEGFAVLASEASSRENMPLVGMDGLVDGLAALLIRRERRQQLPPEVDRARTNAMTAFPVLRAAGSQTPPGSFPPNNGSLASELATLFQFVARDYARGVLLTVDDADLLDDETLALLQAFVAESPKSVAILAVSASDRSTAADAWLARSATVDLELAPLSDQATAKLVESFAAEAGLALAGELRSAITELARGLPGVARGLVRLAASFPDSSLEGALRELPPVIKNVAALVADADTGLSIRALATQANEPVRIVRDVVDELESFGLLCLEGAPLQARVTRPSVRAWLVSTLRSSR